MTAQELLQIGSSLATVQVNPSGTPIEQMIEAALGGFLVFCLFGAVAIVYAIISDHCEQRKDSQRAKSENASDAG